MCRSIKTLRMPGVAASEAEMQAAALQYVRKISGFRAPSRANQAAFERAVEDIARVTAGLLAALPPAAQRPARASSVGPIGTESSESSPAPAQMTGAPA